MISDGFPVLAVAANGSVLDSLVTSLEHLKKNLMAELVVISNNQAARSLAQAAFTIPDGMPEWLSPLVSIVPAQLFAYHLTVARGYDANTPRTIRKVTETR